MDQAQDRPVDTQAHFNTAHLFQVQKEKLHAELKQVLSKKRSHLKQSHSNLASMDLSKDKSESVVR